MASATICEIDTVDETNADVQLEKVELEKISNRVLQRAAQIAARNEVTSNTITEIMAEEVTLYNSQPNLFDILFDKVETVNEQRVRHQISLRRRRLN